MCAPLQKTFKPKISLKRGKSSTDAYVDKQDYSFPWQSRDMRGSAQVAGNDACSK
jgi:hypothetical protein